MEKKVYNTILQIISAGGGRSEGSYTRWTSDFLEVLKDQSVQPPAYLNDFRTLLLFRKYNETKTHLSEKASQVKFRYLVLLWLSILKKDFKDEYIDINARDFIETHSWPKDLLLKEKKISSHRTEALEKLIEVATCTTKGGLFPCPNCHTSQFVSTTVVQKRSGDEGSSVVNVCSKCSKTWQFR